MCRPPSSTTNITLSNGHLSPPQAFARTSSILSASDSDLSDAVQPTSNVTASSSSAGHGGVGNGYHSRTTSGPTFDEDAIGSDDADYDMETPPPAHADSPRHARSSSQDSRHGTKRKVGLDDDDFMLNDPELYGLRRSVGYCLDELGWLVNAVLSGSCSAISASCEY